jgi:hypothetical protein
MMGHHGSVVVGSRDHGRVKWAVLGRVSHHILQYSPVSVMVADADAWPRNWGARVDDGAAEAPHPAACEDQASRAKYLRSFDAGA